MVALFAGLKWRLLTSRLRAATGGKRALLIVGLGLAGVFAAFIGFGFAVLRTRPEYALVAGALFATSQLVAWALSPLLAFGVDETVDPQRFALLPLTRRSMLAGLTVSAAIGWLPFLNGTVLVGLAFAISPTLAVLPIGVLCVAVQLWMCIVVSRATSTALAGLMATRRGRDLGMFVSFGIFVLYIGLNAMLSRITRSAGFADGISTAGTALGWTPPGALVQIPTAVADGNVGGALLRALIAAATIAVGYWWWATALRSSLESGPSVTESSAPAGTHTFGRAGAGAAVVVAARDRLLTWRDPMRRMPWLLIVVFMLGMPFFWVPGSGALFTVAFGALLSGTQVGNQFGVDGSGVWLHLVATGDRTRARAEILGHLLLVLIPGSALVVIGVTLVGLIRGDQAWIPAALGLGLAALLGAAGMASFMSAAKPYAMPQSRGSMFASSIPQHKGRTFGVSMAVMFGGLGLALPAVVFALLAIADSTGWGWAGLVIGPVFAGAAAWWLVGKAARRYYETGPEIFAEVRLGDRS